MLQRTNLMTVCIVVALMLSSALFLLLHYSGQAPAIAMEPVEMQQLEGNVTAPDFPQDIKWLNTDKPISLRELRGKVVLLDFWTYCCINCMHIIPDLKKLEKKYLKELVVIGVHSAKFSAEQDTENIRQAILRYEIEHPVINDRDRRIWNMYTINSWPSLVLIDPNGKIIGYHSGEGIYDVFDGLIGKVIMHFDEKGKIDRRPLKLILERSRVPDSLLYYPGKVLADEKSQQLFIADSNHNRIIVAALSDHMVKQVIGKGEAGFTDGDFDTAAFDHPQGMAYDGKKLYVADTENHSIRVVDLQNQTVKTIAGTGRQAIRFDISGPAIKTPLNSPWDVVLQNGTLYVAMAGSHQIWKIDLVNGQASPHAGTGQEARIDGSLSRSALAQPSGITSDGQRLYFADSEDSSIRSASLDPAGRVETLAGGDLFDFGDRDARGLKARFQHPLGVTCKEDTLYVADTYNNKIRVISLRDNIVASYLGSGEAGYRDGSNPIFNEPGGLSIAGDKLYIADTNNHLVRVADLKTKRVETVRFKGLEKLKPRRETESVVPTVDFPAQVFGPGEVDLVVNLDLPAGTKLNLDAPSYVRIQPSTNHVLTVKNQRDGVIRTPQFPLRIQFLAAEGETDITLEFEIYYCSEGKESLCYFKVGRIRVPVTVKKGSTSGEAAVDYRITPG